MSVFVWERRHGPAQPRLAGRSLERYRSGFRGFRRRCLRSFHSLAGAGHWPGLFDFDDAMPWTSSTSSGRSDRGRAAQVMLSRAKLEREHHQRDAENEGVGSQPPGEHNRADQRRDDKEHAIRKRQQPAQNQPPPAMIDVQLEARGRHQSTRDNRPCSNQPDERNNGEARPEKSGDAHGDIEQPFKYQQSPAVLLAADRPHRRNDSEDAIDQHTRIGSFEARSPWVRVMGNEPSFRLRFCWRHLGGMRTKNAMVTMVL